MSENLHREGDAVELNPRSMPALKQANYYFEGSRSVLCSSEGKGWGECLLTTTSGSFFYKEVLPHD